MLANNAVTHDTRVIKTAESLAAKSYDVTVLCRKVTEEQTDTHLNGVTYKRYVFQSSPLSVIKALLKLIHEDPKKIFIFPPKTLFLFSIASPLLLCFSLFIAPFGLLSLFPSRFQKSGIHKAIFIKLINRIFNHTLLHTYITLQCFVSLYPILKQSRPDIIHAHDIDTLMLGAIVASELSIPYIYDAHEYECHRIDRTGTINRFLIRNDEKKYIQNASVITVSEGIAKLLEKNYAISSPIVVYNAPKTKFQSNERSSLPNIREVLHLDQSAFIVVYVGLITISRSLENIIDAMHYTQNVHFAFVGPQYQPMVDTLKQRAKVLNQTTHLHILPAVPYHEVSSFISTADVGIIILDNACVSYQHAMPNKFFETLCAGIPMIISNQAEMNTVTKNHGVGIMVSNITAEYIAKAILEMRQNKDKFKPSREKIAQLQTLYGWEAQEEKLLSLYQHIFSSASK